MLEVAWHVLGEAARRKWVLALFGGVTLMLLILASSLELEVIDGALAASRVFGSPVRGDIRAVDVALRPLLQGAAYVLFYGGLVFGILSCADFGPSLLAPGRIEHLLSLPLRRWQLLCGTFVGVLTLAVGGAAYGSLGFTLILGVKAGLWTAGPLLAGLLACVTFASLYAGMLSVALFVRSAALSAAFGGLLFALGIVAGYRDLVAEGISEGVPRTLFRGLTALLPRVSTLADAGADLAASLPLELHSLASLLAGVLLFGLGALFVGVWRFEERDF